MDVVTVAIVSAVTAMVSAIVGPLVSLVVSKRQIRASVISNNRERWVEALRDSVAEYVALVLTASIVRQALEQDPVKAVSEDRDLRQIVERIVLIKNKILLMINPSDKRYSELCHLVETIHQSLTSADPRALASTRSDTEAITQAGREVLMAEWARVKRGD
jgi:hypothetical protein